MDDIVKEAREAIALSYDFDRENRREAIEDLRFAAGFQWSEQAKAERKNRPMITINRSNQFLRQASNPIRQNMPTLKVEPDGKADLQGAEVINGLFRRIQYNSSASHVYANAVEHMVACGIGWYRVTTDYLDDDSFDQELVIKRIFNPLSVYPDPSSLEPDRSDMNWCLVSELMPRKSFELAYKGKKAESVDAPSNGGSGAGFGWGTSDYVRVAEFWRRKEVPKTLARLKNGATVNITDMPQRQVEQLRSLSMIEATREAKGYAVEMHLVSGTDVLADPYECPCKWIPVVPVVGAEVPLEQGIYRHGLLRFQREPAQLHNYFMSVAAESLGQQPKAPYLAKASAIAKYKSMWDTANVAPTPYLLYEGDDVPQRVPPPPLPTGLIQMAQMLEDSQKAVTGQYDASLGAKSNETSGVAIQGRIEQANQATAHFVDNLEHSLEHTGRILLDMIPKIYDTQRTLRMKTEDGTETEAHINTPVPGYATPDGQPAMINDLSQMNFKSVRVIMGPSYASRRAEAVQILTQLIQAMPQVGQLGGDIVARNLDFDGAEELADRLRAMLPPQILQLTDPDAAAAMAPPPDPMAEMQMQGQQQAMQFELQGAEAKTQQEQAKAAQEAARVDGVKLDNALKMKKLREPAPHQMAGHEDRRPSAAGN